jgi:ribosome maturation factor RimP
VTGPHQPSEALLNVLRQPLASSGLDLEAVEISTVGRRRIVRVLVDKDGGVTLDDLAAASGVVGDCLDGNELLDDRPYTLEVTSPGTDRPLTLPRHWSRNLDRLVRVSRRDGTVVIGRLRDADDEGAVLDVDGGSRRMSYADVAKANVEVEFSRRTSGEEG